MQHSATYVFFYNAAISFCATTLRIILLHWNHPALPWTNYNYEIGVTYRDTVCKCCYMSIGVIQSYQFVLEEKQMLIYLAMIESDEGKSKFEIIYNAYKNLMLYQANKILGNTHDTEDAVHESFLKIIKIIDKIEEPQSPKTRNLVVTIVERTAIDLYRYRRRHPVIELDEACINVPSPKDIEELHGKTDLAVAMATLPTKYREVLLLRYDNGFTEAEVARILSMSQENVHKTVQRAKKKLGDILEKSGDGNL